MSLNRRLVWALLFLCAGVAFLAFAYPMYVIRPFRAQGERELAVALMVRRWGPPLAIASAIGAVVLVASLWKNSRWLRRTASVAVGLFTAAFAVLAHINVYEMMFHPIAAVDFLPAREAKLDLDDMVMAVKVGRDSHAYPIRMMGYHHVVNDWVGGVPLVGTY